MGKTISAILLLSCYLVAIPSVMAMSDDYYKGYKDGESSGKQKAYIDFKKYGLQDHLTTINTPVGTTEYKTGYVAGFVKSYNKWRYVWVNNKQVII